MFNLGGLYLLDDNRVVRVDAYEEVRNCINGEWGIESYCVVSDILQETQKDKEEWIPLDCLKQEVYKND